MDGMTPQVDEYLAIGCGRCSLVGTPECKVNTWREELIELRKIVLETGLTEERKWGAPCYTIDGKNVLLMSCFKDYAFISFVKGVLLDDPDALLFQPTKNSQATRLLRFTTIEDIHKMESIIKAFINNAIEVEKSGAKIEYKDTSDYDFPEELRAKFDEDPAFEAAFEALTPGRQRGYLLYFSGAKQSKTRTSRIEKYTDRIFEGIGMHDR